MVFEPKPMTRRCEARPCALADCVLCLGYIFVSCIWTPDFIFSLCVLPAHFPLHTRLLWTLPLSQYLAVTSHYATRHSSFPLCTDSPMHMFHSILFPLWLLSIVMPMHHSVLQLLTQTLLWCVLYLAAHLRVHFQKPTCTFTIPMMCSFHSILEHL